MRQYKLILESYKDNPQDLKDLLANKSESDLGKLWGCSSKPIKTLRRRLGVKVNLTSILTDKASSKRKWDKIAARYTQEELITLLESTSYVELAKLWDCDAGQRKFIKTIQKR